jgi:hypothetical protein
VAQKKTRRTIERRLRPVSSVWLKHFLASSAYIQAKPAFFKAGLATLGDLSFNSNFKMFHPKQICTISKKYQTARKNNNTLFAW